MSRTCQVTRRGTQVGNSIARRGLAKPKGGIGLKTTGVTKRKFKVNIQTKKIWVPELGQNVRVKLSARALKSITKHGAYRVLRDAGLIKPIKSRKSKKAAAPAADA
ncbi:MAG: 50S ribosomal protein L28 [Planctomycetota bacterium]|nr:MAG: 50S ribosomal protein L28 [Planctomycetota bacterium]